uniref:uncharacterized protein LOC122591770 n=1 Tax=Erigeron canadensis TaxID=72917 RepID=UPI001CB923F0|nr:uncharacterized protein LOC122591770 [Erigeron canadensis]
MKEYIGNLPTPIAPEPKETLFVYLAASAECVSAVLVAEWERQQKPIYFVSRVLQGAEASYPELEKLALALVHAARRLQRYFQAHPIVVLSHKPIKQILLKPEKSGRVAKWAIELGEHDIEFRAQHAIKGQVLANFFNEVHEGKSSMTHSVSLEVVGNVENGAWKLYTEGAASSDGCGAGLMLISPEEKEFTYALRFEFEVTNNEAEYEALLAGLRIAKDMKIRNILVYVDSQLVACQVKGTYEAKQGTTKLYLQKVQELIEYFSHFGIEHIRRNQNKKADALSKLASLMFGHLGKQVLLEVLKERSIGERQVLDLVKEESTTWMTPIYEYLVSRILPADKDEARKIRVKAPQYKILDKKLYKKGFVTPWLRCVGPKQTEMIIREIHEGICGAHSGARSVVTKAMQLGYLWPTMHQDSTALLKNCEACQLRANVPRQPKNDMISVTAAWFGIPHTIISDNGPQFAKGIFPEFCKNLLIKQSFTSVYHPQGNGQVEVTNREIIKGVEKRLGRSHEGWIDELPLVLWSNRTTPKQSNGETPLSLAFGTEAVAPAEFQVFTYLMLNTEGNSKELSIDLDLLDERREIVAIREDAFKKKIEGYYNKRVNPTAFKTRDYVLRLNSASEKEYTGKLGLTWEGPYRVQTAFGNGAYKLETLERAPVDRTWNSSNLRKFHY